MIEMLENRRKVSELLMSNSESRRMLICASHLTFNLMTHSETVE